MYGVKRLIALVICYDNTYVVEVEANSATAVNYECLPYGTGLFAAVNIVNDKDVAVLQEIQDMVFWRLNAVAGGEY